MVGFLTKGIGVCLGGSKTGISRMMAGGGLLLRKLSSLITAEFSLRSLMFSDSRILTRLIKARISLDLRSRDS